MSVTPSQDDAQVPPVLYKYVRPDRVDILSNRKIRFTQPTATNDLFELKPIFDSFVPDSDFDSLMNPTDAMIDEELKKLYDAWPAAQKAKVTFDDLQAMVHSQPELIRQAVQSAMPQAKAFVKAFTPRLRQMMIGGFSRMIGILSLTETPTNQVMWAHYANTHQGFVLEFDTSHSFFNRRRAESDEFFHLRRVNYAIRSASGTSLTRLTGNDIFLTKSSEWGYEREWRMLAPLGSDLKNPPGDDEIVLVDFPPAALRGLIVGARSTTALRNTLRDLVASDTSFNHVHLREAFVPDNDSTIHIRDWSA